MAEEIQMEDGTKKSTIGDYLRSGSCIGDPKVIYEIIELMQSNDNCKKEDGVLMILRTN